MSDHPHLSKLATERLRAAPDEAPIATDPAARDRAIGLLGAVIAEQAQRRRRKRWLTGLGLSFAAAFAGLAAFTLLRRAHPRPEAPLTIVAHTTGSVTIVHGADTVQGGSLAMASGDSVTTFAGAHAALVLSTGTHVEIGEESALSVAALSPAQIFTAKRGGAKFFVAKLGPAERFIVRTDDTEIEVRGTIFRVALAASSCAGTLTRVEVTEGLVVVRHRGVETNLGPGASWPSGCVAASIASPTSAMIPTAPGSVEVPSPSKPSKPAITAPLSSPPPLPSVAPSASAAAVSDLDAQNDLFAEGLKKKRAGDRAGAALTFERFLVRWPSGPLAESAAAERMRSLDGEAARAAAKDYLTRFPNGSAKAEATAIAH